MLLIEVGIICFGLILTTVKINKISYIYFSVYQILGILVNLYQVFIISGDYITLTLNIIFRITILAFFTKELRTDRVEKFIATKSDEKAWYFIKDDKENGQLQIWNFKDLLIMMN
jgi:hypothetical protein